MPTHALDSHNEQTARPATFELVAPGITSTDRLVGTTFAIASNEFITSARLVDAAVGSHYGRLELVGARGVAYSIADILQFSEKHDYAVLSLQHPRPNPLAYQRERRPA
jgi:serine protease Do